MRYVIYHCNGREFIRCSPLIEPLKPGIYVRTTLSKLFFKLLDKCHPIFLFMARSQANLSSATSIEDQRKALELVICHPDPNHSALLRSIAQEGGLKVEIVAATPQELKRQILLDPPGMLYFDADSLGGRCLPENFAWWDLGIDELLE